MKNSSKPLIIFITALLVLVTVIVLISQGLRLKYEELQREFAQLENRIKTEKTQSVVLKANYQMLTEEDIIKKFALYELGLVDNNSDSEIKIVLEHKDIFNLSQTLESLND